MRIEYKEKINRYKQLKPAERTSYVMAVIAAFVGTFVWFVKIIFF